MSEIKQKRIKILLKLFGEQIKQKIEIENLNISEKEILNKFSNYEITESGKYLEWMTKTYINNGFLYEDLYKVKETLEVFHENKMKLLKDKRDIQQYKTLADLWIEVKKFVEQKDDFLSTNEQKRKEKELAYSETEFFYEDDNVRLVAPLTDESSKWWGKGTRWCTAADKNNMFYEYFDRSPLLIFDFKDGEKWQLWMNKIDIQFMDENDNKLINDKIEEKWEYVENIFIKLLNINGFMLQFIPEKFMTQKLCEIAIKQNIELFSIISDEFKTRELCKIAVQQNGLVLYNVPHKCRTKELYKLAVQQNGKALQDVPENLITKELCEIAVKKNGEALQYVPEKFKTKEICEIAVQRNKNSLIYIPIKLMTKEICEIAVKKDGLALLYVPNEFKTEELCKLAVKQNGGSLFYIENELMTKEICELAVNNKGKILEYVPFRLKTKELCEMAVKNNGKALSFIPQETITFEICELAVKQNGLAWYDVPEEFRTKELYEIANNNIIIEENIVEKNIDRYKEIFAILMQKNELML